MNRTFIQSRRDVVRFEPVDAPPLEPRCESAYVTELRGGRIAFLRVVYDASEAEEFKALKVGQVGRLTITNAAEPGPRHVIPTGVLTCISNVTELGSAVRYTLVITEVILPDSGGALA